MTKQNDAPDQWHLDKKVPLGLILAMMLQGSVIIVAFQDVKKDVEVLKVQVASQRDRDEQQDKAQARQMGAVNSWLERIDGKLDRILAPPRR